MIRIIPPTPQRLARRRGSASSRAPPTTDPSSQAHRRGWVGAGPSRLDRRAAASVTCSAAAAALGLAMHQLPAALAATGCAGDGSAVVTSNAGMSCAALQPQDATPSLRHLALQLEPKAKANISSGWQLLDILFYKGICYRFL